MKLNKEIMDICENLVPNNENKWYSENKIKKGCRTMEQRLSYAC
jgi:hypothetical protein